LPAVVVRDGTVQVVDAAKAAVVVIGSVNAQISPGQMMKIELREIAGRVRVRGGENDPSFGCATLEIEGAMEGLKPALYPQVRMTDGYLRPLPDAAHDRHQRPLPAGQPQGGQRSGAARDRDVGQLRRGQAAAVDRPRLGQRHRRGGRRDPGPAGRAVLARQDRRHPPPTWCCRPSDTTSTRPWTSPSPRTGWASRAASRSPASTCSHEKLASEPLYGLSFALHLDGALDPDRRRLEIGRFEGRMRDLVGRISGSVELAPGTFQYADGSQMPSLPKIELRVQVPKIPCAKLLTSIPGPVVARLQGFVMTGSFEADLHTKIDYSNLEALELGGKVGIDGCKVTKAPDEILKLAGEDSIIQVVEVPPKLGGGTGAPRRTCSRSGPTTPTSSPSTRSPPTWSTRS
jgi:hypothetical protein